VGTPAPFFRALFNDGKLRRSTPAFDLMHYVIWMGRRERLHRQGATRHANQIRSPAPNRATRVT
jgi:hypothetical protein